MGASLPHGMKTYLKARVAVKIEIDFFLWLVICRIIPSSGLFGFTLVCGEDEKRESFFDLTENKPIGVPFFADFAYRRYIIEQFFKTVETYLKSKT